MAIVLDVRCLKIYQIHFVNFDLLLLMDAQYNVKVSTHIFGTFPLPEKVI